ncbi:protein UXT homolog [Battus philenor]|uniref:protein UXT homolog n=1 Tax=Battus philenor TaxID=42288 RepID=UPI0035CF0364
MNKFNVDERIAEYEGFINNVLKEDLRQLEIQLQNINSEISDLIQQKHSLKVLTDEKLHPNGFKSQVNLGCEFYMEAAVTDTSKLLMDIGLNHFLEFTVSEANKYIDARIKAYEIKAEEIRNKSVQTKAHIKLMLFGVGELKNTKDSKKS